MFEKLPRRLKVGSYKFNVEIVKSDDPRLCDNDGLTVFDVQTIYLRENMNADRAAVVLLHESIHVINWVFGIDDESTEEEVTTQVSTGLMSFWNDNPRVMTWLNRTRKIHDLRS